MHDTAAGQGSFPAPPYCSYTNQIVIVQDGASSCPEKPNKNFSASLPAVLNSYMGLYSHNLFGFCFYCFVDLVDHLVSQFLNFIIAVF